MKNDKHSSLSAPASPSDLLRAKRIVDQQRNKPPGAQDAYRSNLPPPPSSPAEALEMKQKLEHAEHSSNDSDQSNVARTFHSFKANAQAFILFWVDWIAQEIEKAVSRNDLKG